MKRSKLMFFNNWKHRQNKYKIIKVSVGVVSALVGFLCWGGPQTTVSASEINHSTTSAQDVAKQSGTDSTTATQPKTTDNVAQLQTANTAVKAQQNTVEQLAAAKITALNQISSLTNLNATEKANYQDQVNASSDPAAVTAVVSNAQQANFAAAKTAASQNTTTDNKAADNTATDTKANDQATTDPTKSADTSKTDTTASNDVKNDTTNTAKADTSVNASSVKTYATKDTTNTDTKTATTSDSTTTDAKTTDAKTNDAKTAATTDTTKATPKLKVANYAAEPEPEPANTEIVSKDISNLLKPTADKPGMFNIRGAGVAMDSEGDLILKTNLKVPMDIAPLSNEKVNVTLSPNMSKSYVGMYFTKNTKRVDATPKGNGVYELNLGSSLILAGGDTIEVYVIMTPDNLTADDSIKYEYVKTSGGLILGGTTKANAQVRLGDAAEFVNTYKQIKQGVNGYSEFSGADKLAINDQLDDPNVTTLTQLKRIQTNTFNQAVKTATDRSNAAFAKGITTENQAKINSILKSATTLQELESANSMIRHAEIINDSTDATNTINDLDYLTDAQKTQLNNEIKNALNKSNTSISKTAAQSIKDEIKAILNKANNTNKRAETDSKAKATQSITNNPNLSAEEKSSSNFNVRMSDTLTEVNDALKKANDKAATNLQNAKDNGNAQINGMSHLTDAQKKSFTDQINSQTDRTKIPDIVAQANKQNETNKAADLQKGKTDAQKEVDGLTGLTDADRQNIKDQITKAPDQETIDQLVSDAQKKDADAKAAEDLAARKESSKNALDALNNLTPEEKQAFKDQIDAATDNGTISDVMVDATQQDAANKAKKDAADLLDRQNTAKDTITNTLDNLSDSEKTDFINRVDGAKTKEEVAEIVAEATGQDAKNKAAQLEQAKQDANNAIDALSNLTDVEKQGFKDQVTGATSKEEVDSIVSDAKAQDAKTLADKNAAELQKAKDDAKAKIDGTTLDDAAKQGYKDRIDAAKDKAGVDSIVIEATKQDLADAQKTANEDIDALGNLSAEEKQTFKDAVNKATTTDEVTKALQDASNKDEANFQANLQAAKDAANKQIDGLTNLTPEQKQGFKDQVNAAKDTPTIDKVVSDAIHQDAVNKAAKDLQTAKDNANKILDGLKTIDTTPIKDAVNKATTPEEITKLVLDAKNQDAKNLADKAAKDLQDAKDYTNKQIDSLPDLTDAEKTDFKNQVNNSKNVEEIAQAVSDAFKQNDRNKAAKDAAALQAAKDAAKDKVSQLTDLTADEINSFNDQIDAAKDVPTINGIVADAEKKSADNKAAKDAAALQKAKDDAKARFELAEDQYLSPDVKDGFKTRIDNAKDITEIEQIMDEAEAQYNKNKADAKFNKAKEQALTDIDNMSFLTPEQKANFKDMINDSADIEDLQNTRLPFIVNEHEQAEEDAKNNAKNKIDDLKSFDFDKKVDFKQQIDDATSLDEINSIYDKAVDLDNTNSLNKLKEEVTDKLNILPI